MIAVLAERARVAKSFEAAVALEGPLASVQSQVLRQMVLVLEGLVAICAGVGSLVCRTDVVRNQFWLSIKFLLLPECSYLCLWRLLRLEKVLSHLVQLYWPSSSLWLALEWFKSSGLGNPL